MTDPADPARPSGILEPSHHPSWLRYTALPHRPSLRWPDDKAAAISVILDLRASEWESPDEPIHLKPPGGRGIAPFPDIPRMSHREFGHRVGVFRLIDILVSAGIQPSIVVDVMTVEKYERLLDHLMDQISEFIAGGMSASRPITSHMTEEEELHYIGTTLERLQSGLGVRPEGWLGVAHSESFRTPRLLADLGVGYVADWGNDERPYPLSGNAADLWVFPLSWELCDLRVIHERDVSPEDYGKSIREAVEVITSHGIDSGRMLALHLHPWLSGQAFRADALQGAFNRITDVKSIWHASPGEVVAWCRARTESGSTQ